MPGIELNRAFELLSQNARNQQQTLTLAEAYVSNCPDPSTYVRTEYDTFLIPDNTGLAQATTPLVGIVASTPV